jgi:peptide/nickel transport system permease protein
MTATARSCDALPVEPAPARARSSLVLSLRESLRYGRTRAGLVITALIVLVAVFGPLFAPHSPTQFVGAPFRPPSATSPLGTDYIGEDVLSRVLSGGRFILWMAVGAGLLGVVGGTALGVSAGYVRKWLDEPIMRALDVVLAVPVTIFVLLFISVLGSTPVFIMVLVGVGWMPTVARTIRAATLELGEREFINAAEVIGTPRRRILLHEMLPNLTTLIVVELGLRCAWSISLVSVISFLGFGISPPTADWGLMINENQIGIGIQPWAVVAPFVCIALFSIGVNLIADGFGRAAAGLGRKGEG